jgi:hypothetical protein
MAYWRKCGIHYAKIGGVSHDEAITFVGSRVCVKRDKEIVSGEIVDYVRPTEQDNVQLWCAEYGEYAEEMNFTTLCKAKQLFIELQSNR